MLGASCFFFFFFFNEAATTEIYTLSLHDALPILPRGSAIASASPCPTSSTTSHQRPGGGSRGVVASTHAHANATLANPSQRSARRTPANARRALSTRDG